MTASSKTRERRFGPLLVGGAVLLLTAAVAGAYWMVSGPTGPEPEPLQVASRQTLSHQTPPAAGTASSAPVVPKPPATSVPPSFDIARVSPNGDAVLAGRAAPGADVTIAADGKTIARTTADGSGAWATTATLPPGHGAASLTLQSRSPSGAETAGAGSVVVILPESAGPAASPAPPVAVATGPGAAPVLLQPPAKLPPGGISLDALDYGKDGAMRFAGRAPPGSETRLSIDGHTVGTATADAEGRWSLSPDSATVGPGSHRLLLEKIAPNGKVGARVAMGFVREPIGNEPSVAVGHVVVQPGESLWRIARNTYGQGIRYTIIFNANRASIATPNLIYPGQSFTIPRDGAGVRR
jgi:nucleoid-associated protein YgaU